ncbi:DEAD/DEAH box helicase, partial [Microbacterium lushaniae]
YNDRPARSFDDRPRRDDRPARSFDDRPRRDFSDRPRREERPARSDWNASTTSKAHEQHVDVVHEKLQAQAVQTEETSDVTFTSLGLGDNIVRTLADLGAAAPFPIQAATVAPILEGRDVLARGRTGSGKTIAFGAPLVESLLRSQAGQKRAFARLPQALILAPTRELALQIDRTVQPIARSVGLFTTQIYGGVPQARQVGALRKGVDIIIGTPGRIEDLIRQGKLDLSDVRIVVLDEADHMSELGFLEPMQRILRLVQDGAQKLMFSATLDREVAALVDEFLVDPAVYEVAGETQESSTIDHRILVIDHRDKAEILTSLVDRDGKTLVFARTRAFAEMLAEQFDDAGISAVALHGDLNQAKRTRNLERLTSGRVSVLVATDVAARGIHVDDIDLVIQADAPDEYKTYLHRSGRTGRAGRAGTVVTLIPRQRRRRMTEMLQRAEIEAPFDEVRPGDDLLEQLRVGATADVAEVPEVAEAADVPA